MLKQNCKHVQTNSFTRAPAGEKKQQVHLKAMNLPYCLIRKEGCAEQKQHVFTHACDTIQIVK